MQPEQTDSGLGISDEAVLHHLLTHPDFFDHHQEALSKLRVPHETGRAVSLIEKQVSVLRQKCGNLEHSLRDFITVARENEHLHQRLHNLIQEIISASNLSEIVSLTQRSLYENFSADDVHILLVESRPTRQKSADNASKPRTKRRTSRASCSLHGIDVLAHNDKRLKLFSELFESQQTQCGLPTTEQLACFVKDRMGHIGSAAMIPLHHQRRLGVIMLSSKDESRFASGKGVMFLNQLGELISRRLHSYGAIRAAELS